jgi:hypothetical protein
MKGKVIYVDFNSKAKKAAYSENTSNKGFIRKLFDNILKLFKFPEKPGRQNQENYFFKRMV